MNPGLATDSGEEPIIVTLASLAPVAQASPPDPTWVPGFWDDADYDEAILLVSSAVGIADAYATWSIGDLSVGSPILAIVADVLPAGSLPSDRTRAPPA